MTRAAPEYVQARRVLLDALAALEPQRSSLVLVGAQAVYLHAGEVTGLGVVMTTDSDLVLDVDLLSDDPELTRALTAVGFTADAQPGSWIGDGGIRVDVMAVPHQSNRPVGARAAQLPPHGKALARITAGLEPALVDNTPQLVGALDPIDSRIVELRVAGPAALLSAKLIKLHERHVDEQEGRRSRLKAKDVLDCYRLLLGVETEDLVAGFVRHAEEAHAAATSRTGLSFLSDQHAAAEGSRLRALLASSLPGDAVALAQYDALCGDLLDALRGSVLLD